MNDAKLSSSSTFNKFCKMGTAADQELQNGQFRKALDAYRDILNAIEKSGDPDSYLLAKVTLGTLRCHVKLAEFKTAIEIWNSQVDDSLYGIGIYALENAQTKIEDLIAYDMLCAFMHTMVEGDRTKSAKAVNLYLSRVCEHARENGNRALTVQALANWKAHLKEIYSGSIPHDMAKAVIQFEREFGEVIKPRPIEFPQPAAWEKPLGFRETSTVVAKKRA